MNPLPIEPFFTEDLIYDTGRPYDQKRAELLAAARAFLDHHQDRIRTLHQQGASGTLVVHALSNLFDTLIRTLYDAISCGIADQGFGRCVLIAIGGYGRGELNPTSDIDLMFHYGGNDKPVAETISERMLYLLWDLGLEVGYSVRTARDCLEMAESDLTARTALLDSRYLVGDKSLFDEYERQVMATVLGKNSQAFIRGKLEENQARLEKYGSSVYLLEPNIKEGEGGLRHLQGAVWIALVKFKARNLRALLIKGVLSEAEFNEFNEAFDYLWRVRNELHYISGRKNEQIHFDQQEQIATFLGFTDSKKGPGVEQFMQDYYSRATAVEHLVSTLIAKATHREETSLKILGYFTRRPVAEGFYILRSELGVTDPDLIEKNPALMMRAFELAQKHDANLSLPLKTQIRNSLPLINDRVRRSRTMNEAFFAILRRPLGLGRILREMHHLRFLDRFIPEFGQIYCKVQHDAYHIYTVDMHSIFAVEEILKLWSGQYREKKPLYTQVCTDIEKPELLLLAVLLHDIGKGEGKDHCSKGAAMIPTIARRLGLNKEDSRRLQFLVQNHLAMAHISQRRDLHDDKLILQFALNMGMSENLKMLFMLTFADIKAVGPNVWSEWKGRLLQELYEKTFAVLEKGNFELEKRSEKVRNRKRKIVELLSDEFEPKVVKDAYRKFSTRYMLSYRSKEIVEHLRLALSRGGRPLAMKVVHDKDSEFSELTISTLDIPGLFSKITGVMAGNGLNILGAQIHTRSNGEVLDILQLESTSGVEIDSSRWQKIEEELIAVLEGRVRVDDLVQRRQRPSYLTEKARPQFANRVEVDNEVSDQYTVIDIYAYDQVGLLHYITRTLKELGLYIGIAKISTKVDQAADTFYLQDIFGQKLTDPEKIAELRSRLLATLEEIEEG